MSSLMTPSERMAAVRAAAAAPVAASAEGSAEASVVGENSNSAGRKRTPQPANTSFSVSSLSSQSTAPGSSERRKANVEEDARRTAMAIMLRNRRNRTGTGATAAELAELRNNSTEGSENSDDDYDKLDFLEDEIGLPEATDYNLCTEAQLLGLFENIENGDDIVLGHLYDISEGDEASSNGESVVNTLLDRFTDEIIDDVRQASLSGTDGSVNSKATDPSRILSEYSVTNVLHLLSKAVNEADILDEANGRNNAIELAAASAASAAAAASATGRPPRARRVPQRFIDIVSQVLRKPRARPKPLPKPNSGSAAALTLDTQNTQATCARAVLRATTKVRIENNPAPSQARKIHGTYAKAINGDSLCSLCGFTLKERQPPNASELKWSYEHTIPVNLVALYFRIICSNNKYSAAEVEIMSQLGDVSCFNCNYTKSQARFISIPKVGGARPVREAIELFLNTVLEGTREDGFTTDRRALTIKVAIQNIRMEGTYEEKKTHWKNIQTENILKKVQNICTLMNTYVNIEQAQLKLSNIKKYIRQCQAVADRRTRLKSVAFKQIIASLSSHFPWKTDKRAIFSADRESIKKRTYNFKFDTQKPGFYKGFDVLAKRLRMNTNEGPASSPKRPAPSPRNNTRRRRLRRSKQRKSRKVKRHTRRRT
jgi:hypothetical protein